MLVSRSQWPRGLRCRSAATRQLRLWVRIPPGAWMFFCCECSVMSCRGFCDGLITPSEESYRLWYAVVCDLENLWMRRAWPTGGGGCWGVGCRAKNKQTKCWLYYLTKLLITVKCNRKFNDIITHTSRQGWGFSAPVQTGPWPTKPALKWVPSFFLGGGYSGLGCRWTPTHI